MNEFQIETAQNVSINQNVAHIGDRMLGYLIDSLIILFYIISMYLLLRLLDLNVRDAWSVYLLVSLPAFLYYVLLETFWDGKTVGKFVMKTKVVKIDGTKPTFANYFVRWILRIVDVVITLGGLATLTILIKGNGQRIGDIAADTTIITEKEVTDINDTIFEEVPHDYMPTYSQVTVLNDADMQTVKSLFDNAFKRGNHNVILSISKQLQKVMQVETKQTATNFVSTVLKDYSYYTQNL